MARNFEETFQFMNLLQLRNQLTTPPLLHIQPLNLHKWTSLTHSQKIQNFRPRPKLSKDPSSHTSYRPIVLARVLGGQFLKMLNKRLLLSSKLNTILSPSKKTKQTSNLRIEKAFRKKHLPSLAASLILKIG